MEHGFRIVLLDSFLETYLAPIQIPTLFLSAIPLKSDEKPAIKVVYPDNIREDKQVSWIKYIISYICFSVFLLSFPNNAHYFWFTWFNRFFVNLSSENNREMGEEHLDR